MTDYYSRLRQQYIDPLQEQPEEQDPLTFTGVAGDLIAAPFRGVEGAVQGVYDLADFATGDALPDYDQRFLGTSDTIAGGLVESVTQFAVPFGLLSKGGKGLKAVQTLGLGGKAARYTEATLRGAAADFVAFSGTEGRLSDVIEKVPGLSNPVTAYLSTEEDDTEIEGRIKNVLEGAGIGAAFDLFIGGLKGLKRGDGTAVREVIDKPQELDLDEGIQTQIDSQVQAITDEIDSGFDVTSSVRNPEVQAEQGVDSEFVNFNPQAFVDADDADRARRGLEKAARESGELRNRVDRMTEAELESQAQSYMEDFSTGKDDDNLMERFLRDSDDRIGAIRDAMPVMMANRRMLRQMSESQLPLWREIVDNPENVTEAQRKEFYAQSQTTIELIRRVRDFSRVFGQGLRAHQTPIKKMSDDQFTDYLKGVESPEKLAKEFIFAYENGGLGGLGRTMEESFSRKAVNALNEFRIGAMLYGPKTQAVSLLSAAAQTVYMPMERLAGTAMLATGNREARERLLRYFDVRGGYGLETLNGYRQSIAEAWRLMFPAFHRGESIFTSSGSILEGQTGRALSASNFNLPDNSIRGAGLNWMGALMAKPGQALAAGDEFFKQLNGRAMARSRLIEQAYQEGLRGPELHTTVNDRLQRLIVDGQVQTREIVEARAEAAAARVVHRSLEEKDEYVRQYIEDNWDDKLSTLSAETTRAADNTTFTTPLSKDRGTLVGLAKRLQDTAHEYPALRVFVPFIRTPVNILDFSLDRIAPVEAALGGASFLSRRFRGTPFEESGNRMVRELASQDLNTKVDAMGRLGASMAFAFVAYDMAASGRITGRGPSDPDERKLLLQKGWQPYSLVLGDPANPEGYINLGRLDPFATIFGFYADLNEFANAATDEENDAIEGMAMGVMVALANNATNKTYMQGLAQLTAALQDPNRNVRSVTRTLVGSFVPNVLGQAVSVDDEALRSFEAVAQSDPNLAALQEYINVVKAKIPGVSETLEPRRNILGEVMKRSDTGLDSWFNPLTFTKVSDDAVTTELASLAHGFQPPRATRNNINYREFTNDDGQSAYDRWMQLTGEVRIGGKDLRQQLRRLIKSRGYQAMDPLPGPDGEKSPRVNELKRVIRRYQNRAQRQMFREFPELLAADRQQTLLLRQRKLGLSSELDGLLR